MSDDNTTLVPSYLELDFISLVSKLKEEVRQSEVFKDVDYEGSNIAILIELMAYIGDLTTFLSNKIAKNSFIDTSDIYETTHRIANLMGYSPKGYIGASTTLTISLSGGFSAGDEIYIPAWSTFNTEDISYGGETIIYSTVSSSTTTIPLSASSGVYNFNVPVIQGRPRTLTYTGDDLIDGDLNLPFYKYAYNEDLDDENNPVKVYINDEPWERVTDFYENIDEQDANDKVFKLVYDKYERYKIVFSSLRQIPETTDNITVYLLETLGSNGVVGANTITGQENVILTNVTASTIIDNDLWSATNISSTISSSDPETIETIKENAKGNLRSQFRNVTKDDYISHLESRSDVISAYAWGEQEIAPSGDTREYNKVYISTIPNSWSGTIAVSAQTITNSDSPPLSASIYIPTAYYNEYTSSLSNHLKPRKMLCAYEQYIVPQIIYFWFTIGIRIKRTYNFNDVSQDVRNKLIYYFRSNNQEFNSQINFLDIHDYLIDITKTSPTNAFGNISGIKNLIFRDIETNVTIYEPNSEGNYPQYTKAISLYTGENKLRTIQLYMNQFPSLISDLCSFTQES